MSKQPVTFGALLLLLFTSLTTIAQKHASDSAVTAYEKKIFDSLDRELKEIFGPISPKSGLIIAVSAANGYYNFKTRNNAFLKTSVHLVLSPSLTYYHKSGLSLAASSSAIDKIHRLDFYQLGITPSFDYTRNKYFSAGFAYSHYFTKDSLSFYMTPLNNEWDAYFTYKHWWLEPGLSVGYALGSKQQFKKRYSLILAERILSRRHITTVTNLSVEDFVLAVSVKHDFYLDALLSQKDLLMLSPLLMLTTGTQHYGFNTAYSSGGHLIPSIFLPSNSNISDRKGLGLQSVSFIMRMDYSLGKFFLEPQLLADYYLLPTYENRLRFVVAITAGFKL